MVSLELADRVDGVGHHDVAGDYFHVGAPSTTFRNEVLHKKILWSLRPFDLMHGVGTSGLNL